MKRILVVMLAALVFTLTPATVFAQADMLNIHQAQIVNAPNVADWPVTTALTAVSFDGSTTRVDFTKKDGANRWPDVTPAGWAGPLEYTIWLFVNNDGQWVGSGFIQMWNGRDGSGSPADPDVPSLYAKNWYYSQRWAPIFGHGPIAKGETIGFMVTSGNQRDSVGPNSVQERSNIVTFAATDNGQYTFGTTPTPDPAPTPTDLEPVLRAIAALTGRMTAAEASIADLGNRLTVVEARKTVTSCSASVFGIPVSCKVQ
jgi:hypothetical protein